MDVAAYISKLTSGMKTVQWAGWTAYKRIAGSGEGWRGGSVEKEDEASEQRINRNCQAV